MKGKLQNRLLIGAVALLALYFLLPKLKEGYTSSSVAATLASSTANYVQVLGTTILSSANATSLPKNGFCLKQSQCAKGLKCKNAAGVPINNPVVNTAVLNKLVYGTCN